MSPEIMGDFKKVSKLSKEQSDLREIVDKYEEYKETKKGIEESKSLLNDSELKEMAELELTELQTNLEKITKEFITVSDSVYIEKIKSKIPLINKENIEKIFLKIENRTYSPIPSNVKEIILTNFKTIQESITSTLNEYEEKKKTR